MRRGINLFYIIGLACFGGLYSEIGLAVYVSLLRVLSSLLIGCSKVPKGPIFWDLGFSPRLISNSFVTDVSAKHSITTGEGSRTVGHLLTIEAIFD